MIIWVVEGALKFASLTWGKAGADISEKFGVPLYKVEWPSRTEARFSRFHMAYSLYEVNLCQDVFITWRWDDGSVLYIGNSFEVALDTMRKREYLEFQWYKKHNTFAISRNNVEMVRINPYDGL